MLRVREFPHFAVADCLVSVAESTSVETFGEACRRAVDYLTGSSTVGLYLLDQHKPELIYRHHVPEGFLDDYRNGMAKSDALIDSVLSNGRAVDGATLHGAYGWPRSVAHDLLHSWGFSHNMCAPLRCGERIVGVFYTATRHAGAPYTPVKRQRMELLCRAASLALTNLARSGHFDRHPAGAVDCIKPQPSWKPEHLYRQLPRRSAEVAFRVCRGQTNKQIARAMGISDQTVKEHITNLFRRFDVQNRTELVGLLLSEKSQQ
jgi:DNA-binding CsgD family transcriptional regulator